MVGQSAFVEVKVIVSGGLPERQAAYQAVDSVPVVL
jgi:hypothetical protein